MKSRWLLLVALAAIGAAAYGGKVLATPATTPGFSGTTLAKATFGDLDIKAKRTPIPGRRSSGRPSSRRRGIPTSTSSRTPGIPASAAATGLHPQHRLAHASRAEPRDRDAGHGDRIRGRRSDLHAARVLGERDERVRRHRRRGRPHHPRRERRRGEDGRRPVHPEGRHSTDRRDARLRATARSEPHQTGGRHAALQHLSLTVSSLACGSESRSAWNRIAVAGAGAADKLSASPGAGCRTWRQTYPEPYPELRNSYRTERTSEHLTEPNTPERTSFQ